MLFIATTSQSEYGACLRGFALCAFWLAHKSLITLSTLKQSMCMYIGIIDCRPMLQAGRWREPRTEMTTRIAKRYIIASVFLTARELENYPFDRINNNDLMWTRKQETIDVLLTKTETITMLCSLNRFVDFRLQFTSLKPFFGTVRRKESRVPWAIQKSTQRRHGIHGKQLFI